MNSIENTEKLTAEATAKLSSKQRKAITSIVEFTARSLTHKPACQYGYSEEPWSINKATLKSLAKKEHISVTFHRYTDKPEEITLKKFYDSIVAERIQQLIDEATEEEAKQAKWDLENVERDAYVYNMLLDKYEVQPNMVTVRNSSASYGKPGYDYSIDFLQQTGFWKDSVTPRYRDYVSITSHYGTDDQQYTVGTVGSHFNLETIKEIMRLTAIAIEVIENGDLEEPFETQIEEVVIDLDGTVAEVVLSQWPVGYVVETRVEDFTLHLETFEEYSDARIHFRQAIRDLSKKNS